MNITSNNLQLTKFLDLFRYKIITISVQPDIEGSKLPDTLKHFSNKNRVRGFSEDEFLSEEIQAELAQVQLYGFGVFFMVNEGDGVPHTPNESLNCGRRSNVKKLKALFIDTDEADAGALMEKLKAIKLIPQLVVESSPNRYHLYFFIEPIDAEGENILQWEAMQHLLDDLVPNLDQTMCQTNQVLRVPTFKNLKRTNPFEVKIYRESDYDFYNNKFLYDRLEASTYNTLTSSVHINGQTTNFNKYEFPTGILTEGNRRNSICSYIEHIMENIIPLHASDNDYFVMIDSFIIKYLSNKDSEEFLEGGRRRTNIVQYLNDQRTYRQSKQQAQATHIAQQQFDHQNAVEDSKLSDDFYLDFPGDLGFLTKEVQQYTPNTPLELCFAAALMISGALKCDSFRFKGSWPIVNGLMIAGTGVGKSTIKDIVDRTLETAGMKGQYPQCFTFNNSVQSLHSMLYAAGGTGLSMIDESGDYLQVITSPNAPGYAKSLKKYYKEATTGRSEGAVLHPGGSLSYQVPVINGGMLSLWIFIQPSKFSQSLNLADMSDGFIPRFYVFNGEADIDLTTVYNSDEGAKSFNPTLDLTVWLQKYSGLNSYVKDADLKEHLTTVETDQIALYPKTKKDELAIIKRDAVYRLRSESRKINRLEVTIDDDANDLVKAYLQEKDFQAKQIQKKNRDAPELDIFIRMAEMLSRLLCNAAVLSKKSATIDYRTAEACIKFHRFQTDRFFRNELVEMSKGNGEKELHSVIHAVAKASKIKGEPVTLAEAVKQLASRNRPKNPSLVFADAVKQGALWIAEREHSKVKGKKVSVYMLPVSETNEIIN